MRTPSSSPPLRSMREYRARSAAVVNKPAWDFGRLLGIYVVFFFIVAQLISWLVFNQRPTMPIVVGGAFIVAGGVVMSVF